MAPNPSAVSSPPPDGSTVPSTETQQSIPTIALVMKTLTNPFFVEMEQGARRAEADLGVRLLVETAAQETSIDQQIAIIDRLIDQKVDAIVIAPGDSTSLVPVLVRAQQSGIIVVNIDNRLDSTLMRELGLVNVPFISVDNEDGAYQAAHVVSNAVTTPTEAIIIEGIRSAQNAIDRTHGAQRAFAENSAITLVATETAHWKIDEAYTVTKRLFSLHPNIGIIFCANDMMALGALQYLTETSRSNVQLAGFDALAEARAAIDAGQMVVTVDQQAAEQGYLGIRYASSLLAGETVPLETMVPVKLILQEATS
ncbi:MAG: sugar ABC transporter substrate-binding protein [Oscillochloris sp.]|nr:sugar ABC transporter substrate-binding protein [Oscillochloris sp.]